MAKSLLFGDKTLHLDRSYVMGVLNVTPDSFSDGGLFQERDAALRQAQLMAENGASFVDIGGESTRPGAESVSVQEEMDRVLPLVEAISQSVDVLISVDTSTPEIMRESGKLGAHLINDVRALQRAGALEAAASSRLPVCLMHMQGSPKTMQSDPQYHDVISDVSGFLASRVEFAESAGIPRSRILVDPGFGFGKTLEHNLSLLNRLNQLELDCPLLVGMSRKSMIGSVLNNTIEERLSGSLALAAAAAMKGAFIVRVHDVPETVDVVKMVNAIRHERVLD